MITLVCVQVAHKQLSDGTWCLLGYIESVMMNEYHTTKHPSRLGKEIAIGMEATKGKFSAKR